MSEAVPNDLLRCLRKTVKEEGGLSNMHEAWSRFGNTTVKQLDEMEKFLVIHGKIMRTNSGLYKVLDEPYTTAEQRREYWASLRMG